MDFFALIRADLLQKYYLIVTKILRENEVFVKNYF